MREIKFRAWDDFHERMWSWEALLTDDLNYVFELNMRNDNTLKLMQYTGLHDKTGKEIYEGDIVRIRQQGASDKPHKVSWAPETASFVISSHRNDTPSVGIGGYCLEVIGNIHETPELIGQDKSSQRKHE